MEEMKEIFNEKLFANCFMNIFKVNFLENLDENCRKSWRLKERKKKSRIFYKYFKNSRKYNKVP
jgi:hypothetical protein